MLKILGIGSMCEDVNSPHFKFVVSRLLHQTLVVGAVTRVLGVKRREASLLMK